MTRSRRSAAVVAALMLTLLVAPAALADTCCANIPIELDTVSAEPGDLVRLIGLECLNADSTPTGTLPLGSFWLSTGDRAGGGQDVPGPGLPADLPPVDEWLPFTSVPDAAMARGDATITVPNVPDGSYQLWWWCDYPDSPGSGIHYSTGARLRIGLPSSDTSSEPAIPGTPHDGRGSWLLVLAGLVFIVELCRRPRASLPGG